MSDEVLVKLVIEEPEEPIQVMEFEQETIKIGRGRPGKKRKGVDVQLKDESVARVACVVHVRKADDVFVMDMGSGGTRVGDKKVGARAKLTSNTEILVGNTRLTIFIGEDALQYQAPGDDDAQELMSDEYSVVSDETGSVVDANISYNALDGAGELLRDEDLPTMNHQGLETSGFAAPAGADTGENAAYVPASAMDSAFPFGEQAITGSSQSIAAVPHTAPAPRAPAAPPGPRPQVSLQPTAFQLPEAVQLPTSSFGIPADNPESPGVPQGYHFFPMHQFPDGVCGPLAPAPQPIPNQFSGANVQLLLEVSDRLGRELWFEQEIFW